MSHRSTALAFFVFVVTACSDSDHTSDWMADLDDSRGLAELSIPGTHDTGALFERYLGLTKTQELTLEEQLAAGVRYLDIRCRHVESSFLIYHGAWDQNLTYDQVLETLFAFLDAHPDEVVIVSVMEETAPLNPTRSFEATFVDYVSRAPERWWLDARLPTLGEARGKLVLLRRFVASAASLGIDATAWPDNSRVIFSIDNAASVRIQDAYLVTDNAEKWASIAAMLAESRAGDPDTLYLNYTSGYQMIDGLSNILSVSDDINPRLDAFLADPANREARLGVLVMDHVIPSRVQAVLSTNRR
jgi:1-phosphatidylinositol phosphodiesterase